MKKSIIVIIAIFLFLALGGIGIYYKFFKGDENPNNPNEVVEIDNDALLFLNDVLELYDDAVSKIGTANESQFADTYGIRIYAHDGEPYEISNDYEDEDIYKNNKQRFICCTNYADRLGSNN